MFFFVNVMYEEIFRRKPQCNCTGCLVQKRVFVVGERGQERGGILRPGALSLSLVSLFIAWSIWKMNPVLFIMFGNTRSQLNFHSKDPAL